MDESLNMINRLFVEIFNDILSIEGESLKNEFFENVSITEIHTIEAIGIGKKPTMSQIAKKLNITMGTLTVAVKNLVNKGFVERYCSQDDKRVVNVSLTKKGKALFWLHEKYHREMIQNAVKDLSDEEIYILSTTLEKINNYFSSKLKELKEKRDKLI